MNPISFFCPAEWTAEDRAENRLICYRGTLTISDQPEAFPFSITADSRYKLFVNGHFVDFGPAKGDREVRYFDMLDLAPYLRQGENLLAAVILHCPEDPAQGGNHSLFRGVLPALGVSAGERWRCAVDRGVSLPPEETRFAPLQVHEIVTVDALAGWTLPAYDDSDWKSVRVPELQDLPKPLRAENLLPRPIPLMERSVRRLPVPESQIPANTERSFVLDAGAETCAFVSLPLSGGACSEVRVLYSECYVTPRGKGDRTDAMHGHLEGYEDVYTVQGATGEAFSPFWWRTFRYVRLTVRTADEPLTLSGLICEETGYPLDVKTSVKTSDATLGPVWDISLRTLRRCMHDTYIDCPYYEQLQYIMDTRVQALYTYSVSADDRLARKALEEFRRAQRPDGLLNCSYPNVNVNVIPTFSIFYILMLHDHMMYFGDRALIARHLDTVSRALAFFHAHRTPEGLVDKIGGVNGLAPFWSFIDWAEDWMPTEGMPDSGLQGPVTMESLLYLYGLQSAAALEDYAGGTHASEYRARADALRSALLMHCTDGEGFLLDGPGYPQRSQHAQVFGVLTGTLDPETGRRAMLATLHDRKITQCSVAMCFYLFRALEQTGLYRYTDRYWEIWRRMVRSGCTTCVESEGYSRSECHAWGALALYELPGTVLGVRPAAPGYAKIAVQPIPGYMTSASGTVHTPRGDVSVSWALEDGQLRTQIDSDPALQTDICTK